MVIKFIYWNESEKRFKESLTIGSQKHQYVGIKDITKEEIYDGYILEFNHGSTRTIAEVCFDAPAFCLRIIDSPIYRKDVTVQWDLGWFKDPKIIGNYKQGYTK